MVDLQLTDPVDKTPLIGPRYRSLLNKLDIGTVEDLLHHYPSRYRDFTNVKKIAELVSNEAVTVKGQVSQVDMIRRGYRKSLTKATVADETGQVEIVWFNQPYIAGTLKKGDAVFLSGKVSDFNNHPAFQSPEYEIIQPDRKNIHTARLVPVYPETKGLSSKWLRSRINFLLEHFQDKIDTSNWEYLPNPLRQRQNLVALKEALYTIHFPRDKGTIETARTRLAFDEIFLLQLRAQIRKQQWQERPLSRALKIEKHRTTLEQFVKSLPFELTNAQKRCIAEILEDLESTHPANRLLEGDVGSGKTVVAAVAIYATHLNGCRSLYMAPTEILAQQQYQTLKNYFDPLKIKVGLLTGSVKNHREVDILVGTHALLHNRQEFPNLGLVVIDEQHRFGVEQRTQLLKKTAAGTAPHFLTMTATPIPRSLALTLYGDLDLSYLDEMPQGRQTVQTWVVPPQKRTAAYGWIRQQIAEHGSQTFIICPLIEESETETLKSLKAVTTEFERLQKEVFPELSLGLMHGRMKSREKDEVLKDFKDKKHHILISTPVVEVGIDIPNATIMLIEGAERFGLASLHQLRGRVGRSAQQSYCLLFASKGQGSNYRRLKAMEKHHNGVELAEIDLKIRGPGEIFGTRQHGHLKLKIADPTNVELLRTAKEEAEAVVGKLEKYPKLYEKMRGVVEREIGAN